MAAMMGTAGWTEQPRPVPREQQKEDDAILQDLEIVRELEMLQVLEMLQKMEMLGEMEQFLPPEPEGEEKAR
jgi:hypothetical protein